MRLLLENVRVRATDGDAERTLLAVDRFTLASGERLGLRGASGSGKTTFLKVISGILRTEGSVLWNDTNLSRLSEAERDAWRGANIGFLFQDFRLFNGLNALENVLLPVTFTRSITDADRRRGSQLLGRFGVRPQTEASRLSRGEMLRTALVRVLLQSPAVILADEPTASLDKPNARAVMTALTQAAAELESTLIVVTHDPEMLSALPRIAAIEEGRLKEAS